MRPSTRRRLASPAVGLAAALALAAPTPALAAPLPLRARPSVGSPPRPVDLRLEATEAGVSLEVRGRGRPARVTLPLGGEVDAEVSEQVLAGGAAVAIVRLRSGGREIAALVTTERGAPAVPWTGRLDLHGDPGERQADALEVADRTGDGVPDVIVGVVHERHRICGQERTLLAPRAVDPATLALRPVTLRNLPEDAEQIEVEARPTGPGTGRAPLLPALRFYAASSVAGQPEDPALLPAPTGLGDHDPATYWSEGRGGDGRFEFATATWTGAPYGVRHLAFVLSPSDGSVGARLSRPRTFWVVGDAGPRLHVTVSEDPLSRPGAPYWVELPRELDWQCLSVVLDEAFPADGAASATTIADVWAMTELDYGRGLPGLVSRLAEGGQVADQGVLLLGQLGAPAVEALRSGWADMTPPERRFGVRALGLLAPREAAAREALAMAAREEDEEVSEAAVSALASAGEQALAELGALAAESGAAGDRAALALGRTAGARAVRPLLVAMAAEGGADRPALRDALQTAVGRGGPSAEQAVAELFDAEPAPGVGAAVSLALAGVSESQSLLAAALLRATADRAERFEDRYRMVQAAGRLPADPTGDAWLAEVAASATEWMLRAEALEALAARRSERAAPLAREALTHDYPRVRIAAIHAFGEGEGDVEAIAIAARRDPWPMVRAAAVRALATRPRGRPIVQVAIRDRSRTVRAAAVETSTATRDVEALPRVVERLANEDEWPVVLTAGIAYLRGLCLTDGAEALEAVVERALRPEPWAPDVDLAIEAIEALGAFGGPVAERVLTRAAATSAPPPLQAASARARRADATCAP